MKKTISTLLALALCVSLCACGVDEKFSDLLSAFEAEDYAVVKQEMLVLSPEFKAEQELLQKYEWLIKLMEAEDYENAIFGIEELIPEPPKPASTEVELNMDNWSEYFKIVETPIADPFGKLYQYNFSLVPNDSYIDRIDYETEFEFFVSHKDTYRGEYRYSFDAESGEFSYLDANFSMEGPMNNVQTYTNFNIKEYVENDCKIDYDNNYLWLYAGGVLGDIIQKYTVEIEDIKGSIFILD